jgi:DNA-binding transcriptional LysR family regulator
VISLACPDIEVQLQLTDRALNLAEEGYDVGILVGDLPDARLNARRLALNSRLCAHPRLPRPPRRTRLATRADAASLHRDPRERGRYGTWHLQHQQSTARQETVKVRGMAATNDGEVAVNWALQGHGIVLRSEWEVAPLLRSGRLRQVLPEWSAQAADIHAVFLSRDKLSARVRAFVDFAERFGHYDPAAPYHGW